MLDSCTGLLLTDGGKPGVLSQATGLGFHLSDISIRTGPASQGPPLLPGGLCDSSSWSAPTHTPHMCIPHDIHVYHTPQTHVCTTYNIQSHHTAQVCTPYTTCASHIPHVCSPTHVPCIPHTPASSSSFIFLQALFRVARAGWLAPAQERPLCAVGMLVRVFGRTPGSPCRLQPRGLALSWTGSVCPPVAAHGHGRLQSRSGGRRCTFWSILVLVPKEQASGR